MLHRLLGAWLSARSIARGLPAPVAELGGYRVETGSEKELRRWVFAQDCEGLRALAREIEGPRQHLKLLASDDVLSAALDVRWALASASFFMRTDAAPVTAITLPGGYRLEQEAGEVCEVRVVAPDGELAASGYGAETADAFVYDRIVTEPGHMRRGLGTAVMQALSAMRSDRAVPQLLVATAAGRALYETLGWDVIAPYATASIPETSPPQAASFST